MDDLSSGAPEIIASYDLYLQSKLRLAEGGFNLRKFVSNYPELTSRIQFNESSISVSGTSKPLAQPEYTQSPQALSERNVVSEEDKTYVKSMLGAAEERNSPEQRVLGVRWNTLEDAFIFDLAEIVNFARDLDPTKRNVVSVAAKFYDPLGFLSPVIVKIVLPRTLQNEHWLG